MEVHESMLIDLQTHFQTLEFTFSSFLSNTIVLTSPPQRLPPHHSHVLEKGQFSENTTLPDDPGGPCPPGGPIAPGGPIPGAPGGPAGPCTPGGPGSPVGKDCDELGTTVPPICTTATTTKPSGIIIRSTNMA
jgi:hypothetical protein